MNDNQKVFKLDEGYRNSMMYTAFLCFVFLILGLIALVLAIVNPRNPIVPYVVFATVVFFVWLTRYFYRYYTGSERFTVRVEDHGLRFGADENAPLVPWSEIRGLRPGRSEKLVDVVGFDDKPRGSINLRLERISDLLQTLMNTIWNTHPQTGLLPPRADGTLRFKRSYYWFIFFQLFIAGFIALAVILDPEKWYGVPIFLSPLWGFTTYDFLKDIRWIELSENLLVVKTLFSRRRFTGEDIWSVELVVPARNRYAYSLNVLIRLPGGKIKGICPVGNDSFIIFWNCRRFLNRTDEITVFQQVE